MNQSKHLDQIFLHYHRAKLIYFKLDEDEKPIVRILYAGTACDGKMSHTEDAIIIDKEQFHLEASTTDTKLYINNSPQHADNNIYVVLQVRFEREKALAMLGLAYTTQEYDFDEIKRFLRRHCEPLLTKQAQNSEVQDEKTALFEFDNGRPFIFNGLACKYLQRPLSYQKQRCTCLVILDLQQTGFELALFNCITFFADPQLAYNYVYCIKGCSQSTFEVVTERTTLFKQINIVEDHGLSAAYLRPGQRLAIVLVRTHTDPGKAQSPPIREEQGAPKSPSRLHQNLKEAKSIPIKPAVKFMEQNIEEQKTEQLQSLEPRPEIMKVASSLQDIQLYLKQQNILTTIASKSPFTFDERRFCFSCLGVETKMLCRTPLEWENGWTIVVFANPKAQGFAELIQTVEEQCARVSIRFNRFVALQSISQAGYHSYGTDAKFLRLKNLDQYNIIFDENSLFGVLDANFPPGTQCCFIVDNNNNLIASAIPPVRLKPIFSGLQNRETTQMKETERLAYIAKAKNGRVSPLFKAVHRANMQVPE